MMRFAFGAAVILQCGVVVADARLPASAVRSSADMIIAFDTLQAEKAMDKDLWSMIQKDKNRAKRRSHEKSMFNTEGRDIAGIVNVSFLSFDPLRYVADGSLLVSGGKGASMQDDAKALANSAQESGYSVVASGGKKSPIYTFDMPEMTEEGESVMPPNGAVLSVLDEARAEFTARWRVPSNEVQSAMAEIKAREPVLSEAIANTSLTDVSFAAIVNAEKLSELPLDGTEEQKSLKELLVQLKTLSLVVRAKGKSLLVSASLVFKDAENAELRRAEFERDFKQVLELSGGKSGNQAGMLESLTTRVDDKVLTLDASVDIRSAWSFLSRFDGGGARKAKANRKKKERKASRPAAE